MNVMKNIQELEKPLEDVDYKKCYKKWKLDSCIYNSRNSGNYVCNIIKKVIK